MTNLREYLTIKDASQLLGVTTNTLRNWGAAGKITEYRHPLNSYRLYKQEDLEQLLHEIEQSGASKPSARRPRRPR